MGNNILGDNLSQKGYWKSSDNCWKSKTLDEGFDFLIA